MKWLTALGSKRQLAVGWQERRETVSGFIFFLLLVPVSESFAKRTPKGSGARRETGWNPAGREKGGSWDISSSEKTRREGGKEKRKKSQVPRVNKESSPELKMCGVGEFP